MAALWSSHYLFISTLAVINAQQDESIYYFGFEELSDWTADVGSFDSSRHTFKPITWYNWDGDFKNCPRYNDGDVSQDAASCLRLFMDASISRIISTVGYHSIRLQIDVNPQSVEHPQDEWCFVQYRTATTNWITSNIVNGHDAHVLDFDIAILNGNNTYNNQSSFEVRVGIDAATGGDSCLFDNLEVFGVPYPTTTTTIDAGTTVQNHDSHHQNDQMYNIIVLIVLTVVLAIGLFAWLYRRKIGRTITNLVLDLQDIVAEPGSGLNNFDVVESMEMEDKKTISVEEMIPQTEDDGNTAEGEQITQNEGSERKPLTMSQIASTD
eukprot:148939_1